MVNKFTSHKPGLAIFLKLIAMFLFVTMWGIIKFTSEVVPAGQAVFFRSLFAIPVILLWLVLRGEIRVGLRPRKISHHVLRGGLGTVAMGLSFTGLGLLSLPEVTVIGYAAPVFVVILAAVVLGERIRAVRITAVIIGLIGVMIVLWPRLTLAGTLTEGAALGALAVLSATLIRSIVQIHVRRMVETEHTAAIVFYFCLIASMLSVLTAPFGWIVTDSKTTALLISAGLVGGVAQILVTSAYRFAGASVLAPYDYTSIIFSIAIGYLWFGEYPASMMTIGALFIILGGILVLWRESRLNTNRSPTQRDSTPKFD
ncbi:MAG: DMT family transporter [Aestuariivita sp.]|nr:DMT family transporter [Aestuariivita sp.]